MKKFTALLLHLAFLAVAVLGLSLMYLNYNYGRGIHLFSDSVYEDSDLFRAQLEKDINRIFDYVNYKDVFETDGQLDYNKKMVGVSYTSGIESQSITYTLDELIRYGKSLGYYLNSDYEVVRTEVEESHHQEENFVVDWRVYMPSDNYSEPGDAYSTLEGLSLEIMTRLGSYLGTYNNLIAQPSNLAFQVCYNRSESDQNMYTNVPDLGPEDICSMGKYCYLDGTTLAPDTNISVLPTNISQVAESSNAYDNNNYYVAIGLDTSYPHEDAYSQGMDSFQNMRVMYVGGIFCILTGAVGMILTLCRLLAGERKAPLNYYDALSTESSVALTIACCLLAVFLSYRVFSKLLHLVVQVDFWSYTDKLVAAVCIYFLLLWEAASLMRRYGAKTLWTNSIFKNARKFLDLYFSQKALTVVVAFVYFCFLGANIAVISGIYLSLYHGHGPLKYIISILLAVALAVLDLWGFHYMFHNAWERDMIAEAIRHLSTGDTAYQIDTDLFSGKERDLADSLNNISHGLADALSEQVKSERLKADLITNVSHDIKTPLTSIINYVDLIKREHIQDPKIQSYLDVLEQKSQRLKNLTEDLVEASKASSGNLKLEISDLNFTELVQQTNGEFEEKFALRRLELVTQIPEKRLIIEADGRRLWRILENLYNNAYKYAMEGSRIYVDLTSSEDMAVFTIKNVSESPLNIDASELTERFVRGDVARTTEGSGLGLSIAKNLTTLQKGTFDIVIDGDLFKVLVAFPLKRPEEPAIPESAPPSDGGSAS